MTAGKKNLCLRSSRCSWDLCWLIIVIPRTFAAVVYAAIVKGFSASTCKGQPSTRTREFIIAMPISHGLSFRFCVRDRAFQHRAEGQLGRLDRGDDGCASSAAPKASTCAVLLRRILGELFGCPTGFLKALLCARRGRHHMMNYIALHFNIFHSEHLRSFDRVKTAPFPRALLSPRFWKASPAVALTGDLFVILSSVYFLLIYRRPWLFTARVG